MGFSALVAATEAGFEKSAGVKSAGPRPVTPASPRRSAADVRLTRGVGILAAGSADSAPATPSGTSGHASAPPSSDPPVESTPAEGGRGATVSTEVAGVHGGAGAADVELTPAVPIKKSVTSDYIICLEDGKKLKMLKRYLRSQYGLTPEEYRARWGLPHDYPMVAPNYAAQRSKLAKQIGLGRAGTAPARGRRKK